MRVFLQQDKTANVFAKHLLNNGYNKVAVDRIHHITNRFLIYHRLRQRAYSACLPRHSSTVQ